MTPSTPPTTPNPLKNSNARLTIAAVERETGLGKDTLRVWERRYGFPTPTRDTAGDRLYNAEQVRQLKWISRLLDAGLRPGKIVGLDDAALQALLAQNVAAPNPQLSKTKTAQSAINSMIGELLSTIGKHDPRSLRHSLSRAQLRMGLTAFITDLVAPLNTAVGEAWALGRFEVFEEHLYTEIITSVLRHAIGSLPPQPMPQGPKVLLTTVPQEQHGLGLLMVEALLVLDGCSCVSLGTQTPLSDIVQAALAHRVDVVALSFTNQHKASMVQASLRELREQLPASTALWVGGDCPVLYQWPQAGISAMQHLSGLQPLVTQWRHAH